MYEETYASLKAARSIDWDHSVGSVELNLSFDDGRTISLNALPIQVLVLNAFLGKGMSHSF